MSTLTLDNSLHPAKIDDRKIYDPQSIDDENNEIKRTKAKPISYNINTEV